MTVVIMKKKVMATHYEYFCLENVMSVNENSYNVNDVKEFKNCFVPLRPEYSTSDRHSATVAK